MDPNHKGLTEGMWVRIHGQRWARLFWRLARIKEARVEERMVWRYSSPSSFGLVATKRTEYLTQVLNDEGSIEEHLMTGAELEPCSPREEEQMEWMLARLGM